MGLRGSDFVMLCSDTTAVQQIITIKQDEDKLIPIDSHKIMATAGEPGDRVQFSEYIIANVRLYAMRNDDTQLSTHAVAHYTRSEMATALRKVRSRPRKAESDPSCPLLASRRAKSLRAAVLPVIPSCVHFWPVTNQSSTCMLSRWKPGLTGRYMVDAHLLARASQKPYQTNLLLAGYDQGQGPSLYWMDYLATMHKMNIAGTGYGAYTCIDLQLALTCCALPCSAGLTGQGQHEQTQRGTFCSCGYAPSCIGAARSNSEGVQRS